MPMFIVDATSSAPFPNASRVAPANLGGNHCRENITNLGEKNLSVVDVRRRKSKRRRHVIGTIANK